MAVVTGIENGFGNAASFAAAQTIPGSAFTAVAAEGAGSLYPGVMTASITAGIGAGEQDHYRVQLTALEPLILDIDGAATGLDLTLFLYNPSNTLVATVTGSGATDAGSATLLDPYFSSAAIVGGGFWTIAVQAASPAQTGAYTLHISRPGLATLFWGGAGEDVAPGSPGADTLHGHASGAASTETGADRLDGAAGPDWIAGAGGGDVLRGGDGADTILGGDGDDGIELDAVADGAGDLGDGGEGADTVSAVDGANTLVGGAGADLLRGGSGNDRLDGGDGHDTLHGDWTTVGGGQGRDVLAGGAGDDLLLGGRGADRLDGGTGNDTLLGDDGEDAPGAGRDTLLGGAGDDRIEGHAEADLLQGGAGADTLLGGSFGDQMLGAAGNDLLRDVSLLVAGDGDVDTMDGGAGADTLVGGLEDRMLGGEGDDAIEVAWSGSYDTLRSGLADGGEGVDLLRIRPGIALVRLVVVPDAAGGGRIEVRAETGPYRSDHVMLFTGFERFDLMGSEGTDLLFGAALADTLHGGGGIGDMLSGGEGDDWLVSSDPGVPATDTLLRGEAGADRLFLRGAGSTGMLDGGAGNDMVEADGGTEGLVQGGGGDDEIRVGPGFHLVDGGSGADLLVLDWSGLDDAILVTQDGGGDGRAEAAYYLADWTGAERFRLLGGSGDDLLEGGDGNDTLSGGSGADTLNGGGGADSLDGGLGDDLYRVSRSGTVMADAGGTDTVESGIAWTLGAGLEALRLVGTAAVNGGGNALDNLLVGNAGANQLAGGAGADTLDGGGGPDRLLGGPGHDAFILRFGESQGDRVADFEGNGAAAGDALLFIGYGSGATVTFVGGNSWRVKGAAGMETVVIIGGFDPVHDAIFA